MQEDDHRGNVAVNAELVRATTEALTRANAAAATGMQMDPKVLDIIQQNYGPIASAGGPTSIMAEASKQVEPDIDGLVTATARNKALHSILISQFGKEKNATERVKLGDSIQLLTAQIARNERRIELHDANTKRLDENAQKAQVKDAEVARKYEETKGGLKAHGLAPTGNPGIDEETLLMARANEVASREAGKDTREVGQEAERYKRDQADREKAREDSQAFTARNDAEKKALADENLRLRKAATEQTNARQELKAAQTERDDAYDDLGKSPDREGRGDARRLRLKEAEAALARAQARHEAAINGTAATAAEPSATPPAAAPINPDMKAKIRAALGSIDPNSPAGQEIIRKVAGGG